MKNYHQKRAAAQWRKRNLRIKTAKARHIQKVLNRELSISRAYEYFADALGIPVEELEMQFNVTVKK